MQPKQSSTMTLSPKNNGLDTPADKPQAMGYSPMKSVKLARALAKNKVFVRNSRTGQVVLKFRGGSQSGVKDRLFPPYALQDQKSPDSFVNLSVLYTADQLKVSNLEELILAQDLELLEVE